MDQILVTGGAGYIGSHVVRRLAEKGYRPIVYDDLSAGCRESVEGFEFIEGDIGDYESLASIFRNNDIRCVMNFASSIAVGESVNNPLKYYQNNVAKTISLFQAMQDSGVGLFIFSSSAAVYGFPRTIPITEDGLLSPISPYGRTKQMVEDVLRDIDATGGFRFISLRYFNAAGADPSGEIGEMHIPETHLIPLVMRSVIEDDYRVPVYGTDYDTTDGTCIRDFVHVNDLASAHILAMKRLADGSSSGFFNLGNGKGFSVREVIASVHRVTGRSPRYHEEGRRQGDPPVLVASSDRAGSELGWEISYPDLDAIVESAWKWESQRKRRGY